MTAPAGRRGAWGALALLLPLLVAHRIALQALLLPLRAPLVAHRGLLLHQPRLL